MDEITCGMCGHHFDPAQHKSCAVCPLQSGCQLACCPNCGFEVVDPNQSFLARAAARLFRTHPQKKQNMQTLKNNYGENLRTSDGHYQRLTELPQGSSAKILDFSPDILAERKAQLQAYGVIPGNTLWVRQHKPVTVIQVEHTELAFESDLADSIYLEKL